MKMTYKLLLIFCVSALLFTQSACKGKRKAQQTQASSVLIGGYEKEDMHFKVQIGAFEESLSENDAFFDAVASEEIRVDRSPEGLYRYSLGFFKNYDEADAFEQELKRKGYDEAFVVAYGDDNLRIEMPMKKILDLYFGR